MPYFRFTEVLALRPLRPRRRSLRQYGLAVLFVQVVGRAARRRRRRGRDERFERESLARYVQSPWLARLLHRFSGWERDRIEARNHRI